MGYGFYFLLGIRSLPKDLNKDLESVEEFLNSVAEWTNQLFEDWEEKGLPDTPWFIKCIGKSDVGPSSAYSCGGAEGEISPAMQLISEKFPEILFDLYHVSWDYRTMEIYSFLKGKMVKKSKIDHENLEVHTGYVTTTFHFEHTNIPNNISEFFNEEYHEPFEPEGDLMNE